MDSIAGGQPSEPRPSPDTADFIAGVLAEFPAPPDLPIVLTSDVRGLLAPPDRGFGRNTCLVCGHTFRPAEFVVVCPCRPNAPGCRAAVHRDPVRGLICRENWRAGADIVTCPVTLRRVLP